MCIYRRTHTSHVCDGIHYTLRSVTGGGLICKSRLTLVTPWTVALQAPLSVGVSRQKYWSGLPCPPPGDLPDPGSPALQADSLLSEQPQTLRNSAS